MRINSINKYKYNKLSFKNNYKKYSYEDDYLTPHNNITLKDVFITGTILAGFLYVLNTIFTKKICFPEKISLIAEKIKSKNKCKLNTMG